MCRVKAIASSVVQLLRYANCSGSSEAGSTAYVVSDEFLRISQNDFRLSKNRFKRALS